MPNIEVEIDGYKAGIYKLKERPWGLEAICTVFQLDGHDLNFVLPVSKDATKEDIVKLMAQKANELVNSMNNPDVPERVFTESEVRRILVEKGYLKPEEKIGDLKTKDELIKEEAPTKEADLVK